ncbi:laccase, multicopper oxidase, benzenediol:oxygen oxidorectuctase [Ascosphaera aggregata]|nr:laccase, multicopper oxidase, benzenediol:oxygen oxidorectuctase [Ascosphaera aggregata]
MDGVPGATQCPIPPGESMTYSWRATQYGSTWYHSHWSLQFSEGLYGPLIIHGPATADYDVDLGPVFISDWYHQTAFTTWSQAEKQALGVRVQSDTGLINGKNQWNILTGEYEVFEFEKGKKYLLRIIAVQTDSWMRFAIDGHTLTVIATDLVPIRPFTTSSLNIAPGQRYDVIVEANAAADNYWMRSIYQTQCSNVGNANPDSIRAIVRYQGALEIDPLSDAGDLPQSCEDELAENLIPHLERDVGLSSDSTQLSIQFYNGSDKQDFFQWTVGTIPLVADWSNPTNMLIQSNTFSFPPDANIHDLNKDGEVDRTFQTPQTMDPAYADNRFKWAYYILQDGTGIGLSHPFHLHGHDFAILGTGNGSYDSFTAALNLNNPPRRDTATMPGGGWLAIAFKADNPGQSLALQIVERQSEINSIWADDVDEYQQMCSKWKTYYATSRWRQDDSGV